MLDKNHELTSVGQVLYLDDLIDEYDQSRLKGNHGIASAAALELAGEYELLGRGHDQMTAYRSAAWHLMTANESTPRPELRQGATAALLDVLRLYQTKTIYQDKDDDRIIKLTQDDLVTLGAAQPADFANFSVKTEAAKPQNRLQRLIGKLSLK